MHGNVSNIGTPDVVGSLDGEAAKQVRVHFVIRRRATQVRFGVVSFDSQNLHQPPGPMAAHSQLDGHFAAAEKRQLQVQLVERAQQVQGLCALRLRLVIVARARHTQQFALLLHGEARMRGIDPSAFVVSAAGQLFF